MPIPNNISNNAAEIYEASLLYEQHGKCGTTQVVAAGEAFLGSTLGQNGWKMVSLTAGSTLDALLCNNISAPDCNKLTNAAGFAWGEGVELMADIKSFDVLAGLFIVYKDCPQS